MLAARPQRTRHSNNNFEQLKGLSPPTCNPSNVQSKLDSTSIHIIKKVSRSSLGEKGRAILRRILLREREVNEKLPPGSNGSTQLNASENRRRIIVTDLGMPTLTARTRYGFHSNSSWGEETCDTRTFWAPEEGSNPRPSSDPGLCRYAPPPNGRGTKDLPEQQAVLIEQHVPPNLVLAASVPTEGDHPSANSTPVPEQQDACRKRQGVTSLDGVVFSGRQGLPDDSLPTDENIVLPVDSPIIYYLGHGLYVGNMQEVTPPRDTVTRWENDIRVRLVQDLIPVALGLPWSNTSGDPIIEPELHMAGTTTGKSLTVRLEPTVWIWCGGKTSRRAVTKAVAHLDYLHTFSKSRVQ
ncbi:hypothetical protein GP486_003584, partial [Trichoglossum hirsutum]